MPSKLRQVKARLSDNMYAHVERNAKKEKRSVARELEYAVEGYYKLTGQISVSDQPPQTPGPAATPHRMPRRRRPTEEGKHESRGYSGTVPFLVDGNGGGISIIGSCDGYTLETEVSEETACDFPQAA